MIVNKKIKDILNEIAIESVKLGNTKDTNKKYNKKLLQFYNKALSEDEQLYILSYMLESLNFKNIVTDPDNVLTLHSVRLRNITYSFLLIIIVLIIAAILFRTNDSINSLIEVLTNGFKLLSL